MRISPDAPGFIKAWLILYVPGLLVSLVAALAKVSPPESEGFSMGLWPLVFFAVLLGPALETLILFGCTAIAKHVLGSGWLAAFVGAAPIVLLHYGDGGWMKVGIVLWAFVWSAYCYLRMTGDERPFRTKFLFLFGLHALSNSFAVLTAKFA